MSVTLNVENFMQRHEPVTPVVLGLNVFGREIPVFIEPLPNTWKNILLNICWLIAHIIYWIVYGICSIIISGVCCIAFSCNLCCCGPKHNVTSMWT
jgi:hypothetical protein